MFWITLALLVVAITLAGATIAEPFGREPSGPPAVPVRVRSSPRHSL